MDIPEIRENEPKEDELQPIDEPTVVEINASDIIEAENEQPEQIGTEEPEKSGEQTPETEAASPMESQNKQPKKVCETHSVARAAMIVICFLLPLITAVLSAISAVGCEINSKYLTEQDATMMTIAIAVSILIPFICIFFIGREGDLGISRAAKWVSLLPIGASLYLAFHSLTNDLGTWGNVILIMSLVAILFFALKTVDGKEGLKLACILCMFLLGAAIIALLYLDFEIELNSQFKLSVQFGAVGLMLGTIADARLIFSRISTGWFVFLKSVASTLGLLCAGLIFTAFCRGFTALPEIYLACAALFACYSISAIAEMIALALGALPRKS